MRSSPTSRDNPVAATRQARDSRRGLSVVGPLLLAAVLGLSLCTEASAQVVRRINAGGLAYVDAYSKVFAADQGYTPGAFGFVGGRTGNANRPVNGTVDDLLYQTARGAGSFSYRFDGLPMGTYEIWLYFNEAWENMARQRVFQVLAEGVVVLDQFDVFLYCGSPNSKGLTDVGRDRACVQTIQVQVTDSQLNLDWVIQTGEIAMVSAIEVMEVVDAPLAAYDEVAMQVGIVHNNEFDPAECRESIGTGSAWADFDGDDLIDLYVTNHGGSNRLYQNQGDTTGDGLPDFIDVAATFGVDDPSSFGHGAVFIDYDGDGDQDLYLTNWGGNILFENQLVETGTAFFTDVTAFAGVANYGRAVTAAWADFDGDSDLDFYIAKHFECMNPPQIQNSEDALYRNNGDGTFTDVTGFLCPGGIAPCAPTSGLAFSAAWVDHDNDADLDLYVVNDAIDGSFYANVLWRNDGPDGLGGWVFTDVSSASGSDLFVNGMGLGVGDFDNDRDMDFAFSNIAHNNLLGNQGNGTFLEISAGAGIQRGYVEGMPFTGTPPAAENFSWGTAFFDHDNDGWLDLFYANGYINDDRPLLPGAFFWNRQNGTFRDISQASGLGTPGRVRNVSMADIDDDGFVDVFMNNHPDRGLGPFKSNGAFWLYHNNALSMGNTNRWLKVTVEGTVSNLDGIGTRIWARDRNGLVQMRDISSGPTHGGGDERAAYFGLGSETIVDVRIRWPTGVVQWVEGLAVDQHLHVVEPAP